MDRPAFEFCHFHTVWSLFLPRCISLDDLRPSPFGLIGGLDDLGQIPRGHSRGRSCAPLHTTAIHPRGPQSEKTMHRVY